MENERIRKITLVTVEYCNLDCTYCYEYHKQNRGMKFDVAKNIIDSEFERLPDDSIIQIEFIGGEPFLKESFQLIKQVVSYNEQYYPDKDITYVATTNGTCVHGDIQEWLMAHSKNFVISLSLDGRKTSHDTNRKYKNGNGSFDDIDIGFFQRYPIKVNAKMTISPESLINLADDILYVESLGLLATASFATGYVGENNFDFLELEKQLVKLIDIYSNNENELPMFLKMDITSVLADTSSCQKYCGAGSITRTFCSDAIKENGEIVWYPCQGLAPISIGEKADEYIRCTFDGFELPSDYPCSTCKFKKLCSACWATNLGSTGSIYKQSPVFCKISRMCALASSTILFNRLMKKELADISAEEQVMLKALEIIQTEIFDDSKHSFIDSQE